MLKLMLECIDVCLIVVTCGQKQAVTAGVRPAKHRILVIAAKLAILEILLLMEYVDRGALVLNDKRRHMAGTSFVLADR